MRLIVTLLEERKGRLFERLLTDVRECECHLRECRMASLAEGCACFMLAEGKWNHIARLENQLAGLQQHGRVFFCRLAEEVREGDGDDLLYVADVVARERPGVLEDLVGFFSARGIGIQDLRSSCYRAPYVDASLCTIHILLRIPPGIPLISLRDELFDVCERMQMDAILEPVKPIV